MLTTMHFATETAMSASRSNKPQPPSQEDSLDEALEETFPASDPIAVDPAPARSQPARQPPDETNKGRDTHRHGKH